MHVAVNYVHVKIVFSVGTKCKFGKYHTRK